MRCSLSENWRGFLAEGWTGKFREECSVRDTDADVPGAVLNDMSKLGALVRERTVAAARTSADVLELADSRGGFWR
jgi:hypothetical protein